MRKKGRKKIMRERTRGRKKIMRRTARGRKRIVRRERRPIGTSWNWGKTCGGNLDK